mgnify:CR=1 FL=1
MVGYWRQSANEAKENAEETYTNNHVDWAFFFWHLAIEKLFKGIIAKNGKTPLPVHDLAKLASIAGITLSAKQRDNLDEITTYNIDARYDDYKRNFYKKVTKKAYHEQWLDTCREIFLWLSTMY